VIQKVAGLLDAKLTDAIPDTPENVEYETPPEDEEDEDEDEDEDDEDGHQPHQQAVIDYQQLLQQTQASTSAVWATTMQPVQTYFNAHGQLVLPEADPQVGLTWPAQWGPYFDPSDPAWQQHQQHPPGSGI
jgi:hypothetical protein